jgi:hypothetical protein
MRPTTGFGGCPDALGRPGYLIGLQFNADLAHYLLVILTHTGRIFVSRRSRTMRW